MKLKREYDLDGKKKFWCLEPSTVDECAILHLLSKEYPEMFEFISEITTGGLYREVYLKIKELNEKE